MGLRNRLGRLPAQIMRRNPFGGSLVAEPLPLLRTGWHTARNFKTPLSILDRVFTGDGDLKFVDVPGFPPILFVRDPELIREITSETSLKGDFERDTLPTQGIGRVVGSENLLYAQGETWRKHRGAVARPFGTQSVQIPEVFENLGELMTEAVAPQLAEIAKCIEDSASGTYRMKIEPVVKAVMLNVLVNILFGAPIDHEELRDKYLPAIERVIRYILTDTILNQLGLPVFRMPTLSPKHAQLKRDRLVFEELVDRVIETRSEGAGFWPLLQAAGTEEAVRSNVRVFLAGALEATTSYICWTMGNLARHPEAQELARVEALSHEDLSPKARSNAVYMNKVLAESLRLNNALYFLPRVALRETTVETSRGTLSIPEGTHLVLATYHMNRCEKFWGVEATGYPATSFVPERWDVENMEAHGRTTKINNTFGFGHGPRVCVGKHFSEAEAFVCLTLILRRFEFTAVHATAEADSGVSTRPRDGLEVDLRLRFLGKHSIVK